MRNPWNAYVKTHFRTVYRRRRGTRSRVTLAVHRGYFGETVRELSRDYKETEGYQSRQTAKLRRPHSRHRSRSDKARGEKSRHESRHSRQESRQESRHSRRPHSRHRSRTDKALRKISRSESRQKSRPHSRHRSRSGKPRDKPRQESRRPHSRHRSRFQKARALPPLVYIDQCYRGAKFGTRSKTEFFNVLKKNGVPLTSSPGNYPKKGQKFTLIVPTDWKTGKNSKCKPTAEGHFNKKAWGKGRLSDNDFTVMTYSDWTDHHRQTVL